MVENEKKRGFMDVIKDGLHKISHTISASIVSPITDGAETVMKNLDERILRIENRILKKISYSIVLGIGGIFLVFALFFLLIEYLGWSNAAAFFSIGITLFVIGLVLKLRGAYE